MMEYSLATTKETPPDGWKYTQPETGATFSHYDYVTLERQVKAHRLGNAIPMSGDWQEEFQDELCKQNFEKWGPDWCKKWKLRAVKPRAFSFGAAMTFLNFMFNWLKNGGGYVTQEEAETRAAQCYRCEFNREVAVNCGGCMSAILGIVSKIIGRKKTPYDSKLGQCGICHCLNKVSVHIHVEPQWKALSDAQKEKFQIVGCWKNL